MNYSNEIYIWLNNFLFILGLLLIPIGIGFLLFPEKIFKLTSKLNHWVITDHFFNKLNEPIYKERFFYRHHRVFAIFVFIVSSICLYMLVLNDGAKSVTNSLLFISESEFEKWLFIILFYIFTGAIILVITFSVIMFFRPSALKSFEAWGNHWVDAEKPLKILDRKKDLPEKIFLSNPRVFGFLVSFGAIYIVWSNLPV